MTATDRTSKTKRMKRWQYMVIAIVIIAIIGFIGWWQYGQGRDVYAVDMPIEDTPADCSGDTRLAVIGDFGEDSEGEADVAEMIGRWQSSVYSGCLRGRAYPGPLGSPVCPRANGAGDPSRVG